MATRRREAGFTLVEVVVAFVMLAAVLVTGFEIFSKGIRRAADLEDYSRALVIAQARIDSAGIEQPFEEGQAQGESEDRRYRWRMSTTRSEEGAGPAGTVSMLPYELYRVEVRVEWDSADGRVLSVDLATLGLGQRK